MPEKGIKPESRRVDPRLFAACGLVAAALATSVGEGITTPSSTFLKPNIPGPSRQIPPESVALVFPIVVEDRRRILPIIKKVWRGRDPVSGSKDGGFVPSQISKPIRQPQRFVPKPVKSGELA